MRLISFTVAPAAVLALLLVIVSACASFPEAPSGAGGSAGDAGQGGAADRSGNGGESGTGGEGGFGGVGGAGGLADNTKDILVWCTSNFTPTTGQDMPWRLTVDPTDIAPNQTFSADITGTALFNEEFLDIAQTLFTGGVRQVHASEFKATVVAFRGATGPNVVLAPADTDFRCALESSPGVRDACDPANDVGAEGANFDCVPIGPTNACGIVIDLPVSEDCELGGVCANVDSFGSCGTTDFCKEQAQLQCQQNSFCITGPLEVPLNSVNQEFVAETEGEVGFGWYHSVPYSVVDSSLDFPVADIGVRITVEGVPVAIDCMSTTQDDFVLGPLEDEDHLSFPIQGGCENDSELCPPGFTPQGESCGLETTSPPLNAFDPLNTSGVCPSSPSLVFVSDFSDPQVLASPSLAVRAAVTARNLSPEGTCNEGSQVVATVLYLDADSQGVGTDAFVFNQDDEVTVSAVASNIVQAEVTPIVEWSAGPSECCLRRFQTTFTYSVDQCEGW